MNIVCDTNVLVSGLLWQGAPREVLRRIATGQDTAWTSPWLLGELHDVLGRPKFTAALTRVGQTVDTILANVFDAFELVQTPEPPPHLVPDGPDDDHVIACALAAHADVIVSGDAHLLKLGTCAGIRILNPDAYLRSRATKGT